MVTAQANGIHENVKYAVEAIGTFFLAQTFGGITAGVAFLALNPDDH